MIDFFSKWCLKCVEEYPSLPSKIYVFQCVENIICTAWHENPISNLIILNILWKSVNCMEWGQRGYQRNVKWNLFTWLTLDLIFVLSVKTSHLSHQCFSIRPSHVQRSNFSLTSLQQVFFLIIEIIIVCLTKEQTYVTRNWHWAGSLTTSLLQRPLISVARRQFFLETDCRIPYMLSIKLIIIKIARA